MSDSPFKDDDFVYVDTDKKVAIGLVEWDKDGNVKPKDWPFEPRPVDPDKPKSNRKPRKRTYIWGSYLTMKKLYKLEGKVKDKDTDDYITLDDAIGKLQENPYWN
ncbi:hypothetical protein HOK40_00330 [Candidatus Peregrinibacteria bacterium]|jgi:hypothetical protein|nr:hypothetical protein [Candidatus Peregrinibacteria bacterium]MBT7337846.1 hypothetical protein [Candidatus Peregrinibacteria bacterium]